MRALISVALLPPLLLMIYVNSLDKREKESTRFLAKLFFFGILSVIPAVLAEEILSNVIHNISTTKLSYILLENFLEVALVEEVCKYILLRLGSWKSWEFDHKFDGIVYSVFVSMGFAAAENLMYVISFGLGTGLIRAFTSIPGHAIFGIFMGYYYSHSKDAVVDQRAQDHLPATFKAIAIPTLLHGIFDFILSLETDNSIILFFGYAIIMDIVAYRFIRKASRNDEAFRASRI